MLPPRVFALALSALTFVAADTSNFTINPNEIDPGTRSAWCRAEINTCGMLCSHTTASNDCNPTDLSFHCTCQSNNSAPGLQFFTETMPTFVCQQAFQDCISKSASDKDAQDKCISDIQKKCGTIDPNKAQLGGPSSTTSGGSTGSSSSPTSTSTPNLAAANAAYLTTGAGVAMAGLFAAFL